MIGRPAKTDRDTVNDTTVTLRLPRRTMLELAELVLYLQSTAPIGATVTRSGVCAAAIQRVLDSERPKLQAWRALNPAPAAELVEPVAPPATPPPAAPVVLAVVPPPVAEPAPEQSRQRKPNPRPVPAPVAAVEPAPSVDALRERLRAALAAKVWSGQRTAAEAFGAGWTQPDVSRFLGKQGGAPTEEKLTALAAALAKV